jgi:hypothetical protein
MRNNLPHKNWLLIVINTSDQPYDARSASAVPPGMVLHHIPYPYAGYAWYLPQHYATPEGLVFDSKVVAVIRQAIVTQFPLGQKYLANAVGPFENIPI